MRKRNMSIQSYGISQHRYRELSNFCRQYPEWKSELLDLQPTAKSQVFDGMPHSQTNSKSDPTASMSMKRVELEEKISLVEDTVREAAGDIYEWFIRNVCYDETINYLISVCECPTNPASFSDRRKYFFYLLDKKRK